MTEAIISVLVVIGAGVGIGMSTGDAWLGFAVSCAVYAISPYPV